MSKKVTGVVSHDEQEIAELRADPALAVEYLKVAMGSLGAGRCISSVAANVSRVSPVSRSSRHSRGKRFSFQ